MSAVKRKSRLEKGDKLITRLAEASHADLLTNLTRRSKAHWGYSESQIIAWHDQLVISQNEIMEGRVWIGTLADTIVGYYSYEVLSTSAIKLDNLFLDPAYIGKGLGKVLMQDFLDRAKQQGFQTATLNAEPYAEPFYRGFGFQVVDQLNSSIPGRSLPVMELNLLKTS